MHRHRAVAEQVVVVHGATGSVGRATVLEALRLRARVTAVGVDARALDALETEADMPHRLEAVLVDPRAGDAENARRVTYATTARFGLLHSWVHVAGPGPDDALPVGAATTPVLHQLRRSGGGAFVVVAPEPDPARRRARAEVAVVESDLVDLRAAAAGAHDVVSVTVVRREGIVPPDRVAQVVLRAAVRPRAVATVHGSARRDALVAHVTRRPAPGVHTHRRPERAWLLR